MELNIPASTDDMVFRTCFGSDCSFTGKWLEVARWETGGEEGEGEMVNLIDRRNLYRQGKMGLILFIIFPVSFETPDHNAAVIGSYVGMLLQHHHLRLICNVYVHF